MGQASLGFANGPGITFRIDPQAINWGFEVNTSVTNTIGGRVVQVIGATLSDITIQGQLGEDISRADGKNPEHAGRSWRLAKRFNAKIREMMEFQARDARQHNKMHQPAVFSYPPKNWRFYVYIKALTDPSGGTITHMTGKFSYDYVLTLFIVQEGSGALVPAGSSNGVIDKARAKAINDFISRVSDGIGWQPTKFNGAFGDYYGGEGLGAYGADQRGSRRGSKDNQVRPEAAEEEP